MRSFQRNSNSSTALAFFHLQTPLHLLAYHRLRSISSSLRCADQTLVLHPTLFPSENTLYTCQNRQHNQFLLSAHHPQSMTSSALHVYCFCILLSPLSGRFHKKFSTRLRGFSRK